MILERRELSAEENIAAYRAFILKYQSSPLAVAAFDRLMASGDSLEAWPLGRTERQELRKIERLWIEGQRRLSSPKRPARLARLSIDGPVESTEPSQRRAIASGE